MNRPAYQIVEHNGAYWVGDEYDLLQGPYLNLWEAERELEWMTEEEPEDDDA